MCSVEKKRITVDFSSSSCSSGSYSGNATEEDDDWEAFAHSLAADDEVNHEKENHSPNSGSYSGNATEEDDDWEAFAHSLAADDEVNHEKENHSPKSCEGHCYDQVV
ncbi:hypothetical protein F2Q69_00035584 [Brassica cretica]|uniref:Uncharacterized protein n=1 Tax=Brassica cretica TaxID=69181 RepID=A0A8S9SP46_BRACR|nr:hypothetical protein F2Q69_00035584 [Brassica cretica]